MNPYVKITARIFGDGWESKLKDTEKVLRYCYQNPSWVVSLRKTENLNKAIDCARRVSKEILGEDFDYYTQPTRQRKVVEGRQMLMCALKDVGCSNSELGLIFGCSACNVTSSTKTAREIKNYYYQNQLAALREKFMEVWNESLIFSNDAIR